MTLALAHGNDVSAAGAHARPRRIETASAVRRTMGIPPDPERFSSRTKLSSFNAIHPLNKF